MAILIIDRIAAHRDEIRAILEGGGYASFVIVASAGEALEAFADPHGERSLIPQIDLVIVDILSEIDDRHGFAALKALPSLKGVPVLMTGDASMSEAMQVAFALGATDFVSKPLRRFELLSRSRSAMRLRHEILRRKDRERELLEVTRQLTELNTMLTRLSFVDGLTGVSNRRFFDQAIDQEWRRAVRGAAPISLILLDVDHFKKYNDAYGHQCGDECLQDVATAVKGVLQRPGDVLARVGGEEFGIILPETHEDGARHVAEKVRGSVEALHIAHRTSDAAEVVTVSLGVAGFVPEPSDKPEILYQRADRALYSAKAAGRNCAMTFGPGDPARRVG